MLYGKHAPAAELEGDMADQQMGLQARLMSKALRKITGSLSKSQTTVIFINQLRSKIGVMYGSPEITSGRPRFLVSLILLTLLCARWQCAEVLLVCAYRHPPQGGLHDPSDDSHL